MSEKLKLKKIELNNLLRYFDSMRIFTVKRCSIEHLKFFWEGEWGVELL